ncbi:MAG: hypothetical protein P4L75_07370 [Clostridia bacterium]|nr:hypothetical protein [Clostridia bacterium]MDR3643967.1 hypothetical protein [Clostridia bacterium]
MLFETEDSTADMGFSGARFYDTPLLYIPSMPEGRSRPPAAYESTGRFLSAVFSIRFSSSHRCVIRPAVDLHFTGLHSAE